MNDDNWKQVLLAEKLLKRPLTDEEAEEVSEKGLLAQFLQDILPKAPSSWNLEDGTTVTVSGGNTITVAGKSETARALRADLRLDEPPDVDGSPLDLTDADSVQSWIEGHGGVIG